MVFRSGCGVALIGYMSGTDTPQSIGYQQGVTLMTLTVCFINAFLVLYQYILINACGDEVYLVFELDAITNCVNFG